MMSTDALRDEALKKLAEAHDEHGLAAWHTEYLGRKGKITILLRALGTTSLTDKKTAGPHIQSLHHTLKNAYEEHQKSLTARTAHADYDETLPGIPPRYGHEHPLTIAEEDLYRIFSGLNFSIVDGPELETEYYNFDALNIPHHHPARDMQDTLWVNSSKGLLLRTHTSPVQIRHMERHLPPFQIITIGKVFRHEATDASHETNFCQFEGLMVGTSVTLAHLKYVIRELCTQFFGTALELRFRPSFFPFTEPSFEVDIKIPGSSAWLEVIGGGMVHPRVFEAVNYDPRTVQGCAFGGGLDRLTMLKYGIPDIRLLYENDVRLINQF